MADDILLPLVLLPNVTTIYVIDMFDDCYSTDNTIEGQRRDIRRVLTDGNNSCMNSDGDKIVHNLKMPAVILEDDFHVDPMWGNVWRLTFKYDGRIVNLVYFSRNFENAVWPSEIQNISHIIGVGSYSWECLTGLDRSHSDTTLIKSMFDTRTTDSFTFYACAFNHMHFRHIHSVKHNIFEKSSQIAAQTIEKTNGRANIEDLYPPEFSDGTFGFNKYGQFVPIADVTDPEKNKNLSYEELIKVPKVPCGQCGKILDTAAKEYLDVFTEDIGHLFCSRECFAEY